LKQEGLGKAGQGSGINSEGQVTLKSISLHNFAWGLSLGPVDRGNNGEQGIISHVGQRSQPFLEEEAWNSHSL
jgi:hypothetical protein